MPPWPPQEKKRNKKKPKSPGGHCYHHCHACVTLWWMWLLWWSWWKLLLLSWLLLAPVIVSIRHQMHKKEKRDGKKRRKNFVPSVVMLHDVVAHCGCAAAYSIDLKAVKY